MIDPSNLAPYPSGSAPTTGTYAPGNVKTSDTIQLGQLNDMVSGRLFDAKAVTVALQNGTNQAVTGLTLVIYDTVNGQEIDISYAPSKAVNVAAGGKDSFVFELTNGLLAQVKLTITYAAAPTSGWVTVQAAIQGPGANTATTVTASENIAQVAGTPQTAADWTPLLQLGATKQGALTDRSGTITAGGVSQQLAAANAARRYLLIQNESADILWINFTAAANQNQPSIKLAPGQAYELPGQAGGFVSTELVNIIGPTTGDAFTAKEG